MIIPPRAGADTLRARVRRFVDDDVRPQAPALEHADAYPHDLVARMRDLGLFGALVPEAYGGLGLDVTTYAQVIEELCRGWMSLAGVINSHTMAALIVLHHGTEEQRRRFLPRFAAGAARGGLCLTEAHAGSDVQAIRTVARRRGDVYTIDGTKMFVTNGREGNTFALLAVTDSAATPRHRGMSCFVVEKGHPGLRVVKSIGKLGYKGVDTAELLFDGFETPAANLVGGVEGRGFKHVMSGLEAGRINIAARAVGVAQAVFDDTVAHLRAEPAAVDTPLLADMAAKLGAARLLTYWAAGMKDRGERCDLEAGMAKLYASEIAQDLAASGLRVIGPTATLAASPLERYYRDTPLMIIGEGTNEIQRTIIARNLLHRYGERLGALTSREGEPEDRRHMVLAVRQFVEKEIVPVVADYDGAGELPAAVVGALADLGVLGAVTPVEQGGLGLEEPTVAMLLEELARGWASLATVVAAHLTVARVVAAHGGRPQREQWLPGLARGEQLAAVVLGGTFAARRAGDELVVHGTARLVDNAARAHLLLVVATADGGEPIVCLLPRATPGVTVGAAEASLGQRAAGGAAVTLDDVRVGPEAIVAVGSAAATAAETALAFANLAAGASGVGLAQAAFEAALRYSQQRSTFGKPICQHQAIQLKLADMATAITAARLLVIDAGADADRAALARIQAADMAASVTLEAMRIHGGYGYTTEFPVERFYRDAARLAHVPIPADQARLHLARRLRRRHD
jgi:alkylation response protein AidB-like acyl-CoA dehydrogenase